ncbi:hypothetical protein DOY81_009662 [Sarcophaga bullata]|nr:hypothetical protein DOY81_009662 [Sarcophaga bullata]
MLLQKAIRNCPGKVDLQRPSNFVGVRYVIPVECYECCNYENGGFAGCQRVADRYCNIVNYNYTYAKR